MPPEDEPMAAGSALFGDDGTQLPEPATVLPDALTGLDASSDFTGHRSIDLDRFELPPLPPMPDVSEIKAAIDAVLAPSEPDQPADRSATAPRPAGPVRPPHAAGHLPGHQAPVPPQRPAYRPPMAGPAGPPPSTPPAIAPVRPIRRAPATPGQQRRQSNSHVGWIIAFIIFAVVAVNIALSVIEALQ